MPNYINSKVKTMECFLERLVKNFPIGEFKLIHDGSKTNDFNVPEHTFFTRVYQWYVDGEAVDTQVRFKYNLRTGYADCSLNNISLDEFNELLSSKENQSDVKTNHQRILSLLK